MKKSSQKISKTNNPKSTLKNTPQNHTKTRSKIYTDPFPHLLVSDFLSPELYKKAHQIYDKLQFKQKSSDLFHFFQTNELNSYDKLNFFKSQLDKQFWQLQPMKSGSIKKQQTFYNIFASYYFNGDYLLCHDDIVQDRLYAFSYYLQDHPSGDLVLFNKTADKQIKRIKVKKNTLAIFQVSDISYHQVDYTSQNGRKAITGWFNIKGLGKKRIQKTIPAYIPSIPNSKNIIEYPLPEQYFSQQYFQLMDISYQFDITKTWVQGPFYSRRVHRIQIDPPVIFTLPGYSLYSVQFFKFQEGDYILLNDPVNSIKAKGNDIVDVFVTHLPDGFQSSQDNMLVKIAQPNQQTQGIPQIHDSLFIVRRGKKQYYVDRCEQSFMLGHFIYVKEDKKKVKAEKEKDVKSKSKEKISKKQQGKKKQTKATTKNKVTKKQVKQAKGPAAKEKKTKTVKSKSSQKKTKTKQVLKKSINTKKIKKPQKSKNAKK